MLANYSTVIFLAKKKLKSLTCYNQDAPNWRVRACSNSVYSRLHGKNFTFYYRHHGFINL